MYRKPYKQQKVQPIPEIKRSSNDGIVGTENDFQGKLEEWEPRVLLNASHFRVHRLKQESRDHNEVKTFPEALQLAGRAMRTIPGVRVMIYAVTDSGRHFMVPQKQWQQYYLLWVENKAT